MRRVTPGKSAKAPAMTTSPINFRMPAELRARLRRFAKRRYLGEAVALRLIVAEYLDEDESQRELLKAERWQFQQAYETWERHRSGEGPTVPRAEIDKIFTDALANRPRAPATPRSRLP